MDPKEEPTQEQATRQSSETTNLSSSPWGQCSGWGTSAISFLGRKSIQDGHAQTLEGNTASVRGDSILSTHKSKARLDSGASSVSHGDEMLAKLSRINGSINKMTKEQMQAKLAEFKLNTSGVKDVLKKRLKNYYKRQRMAQCNRALSSEEKLKYDYLVVVDFEATCSETNENFVHEIIEFPAVLVDAQNQAVCNVFQRFCKPRVNPVLTAFCTSLTGISQQQVDKAKDFTEVFKEFEDWMALHKLGTEYEFAILTDGPWDMARFLRTQCDLSSIPFPRWGKQWINLRKAYTAFYGCGRVNLQNMLDELGMKFQGRPHCGLDDSRNIAAIALRLLEDGCIMRVNEHYREGDVSPQKQNALSRAAGHSGGHRSPPKSRLTQKKEKKDHGQKVNEPADVPQEGENLGDLLEYLKLQKS